MGHGEGNQGLQVALKLAGRYVRSETVSDVRPHISLVAVEIAVLIEIRRLEGSLVNRSRRPVKQHLLEVIHRIPVLVYDFLLGPDDDRRSPCAVRSYEVFLPVPVHIDVKDTASEIGLSYYGVVAHRAGSEHRTCYRPPGRILVVPVGRGQHPHGVLHASRRYIASAGPAVDFELIGDKVVYLSVHIHLRGVLTVIRKAAGKPHDYVVDGGPNQLDSRAVVCEVLQRCIVGLQDYVALVRHRMGGQSFFCPRVARCPVNELAPDMTLLLIRVRPYPELEVGFGEKGHLVIIYAVVRQYCDVVILIHGTVACLGVLGLYCVYRLALYEFVLSRHISPIGICYREPDCCQCCSSSP